MKIIIRFEYNCFPVWIYNDNDFLIENDLPESLHNNVFLASKFISLQEEYNSLFIDDGVVFKYEGFKDHNSKEEFLTELNSAIDFLKREIKEEYVIEEHISNI